MANESSNRTAVVLHRYPVCILAVERAMAALGVDVVARATELDEGLALLDELKPDVFVAGLDGAGSPEDRIAYVRLVRERAPDSSVIALSLDGDEQQVDAALEAGAAAYVVETRADVAELAAAIRQAVRWLDVAANPPARLR